MVRTSEPEAGMARTLVLSVMVDESLGPLGVSCYFYKTIKLLSCSNIEYFLFLFQIRHFLIMRVDHGQIEWYIEDEGPRFPDVVSMINHFFNQPTSISAIIPNVTLSKPFLRKQWQLNHEDVCPGRIPLGEGQFGEVQLGKFRKGDEIIKVAIKQTKLENLNKGEIKEVMTEARIHRRLSHPNIIAFYGVAAGQEPLLVVMEFADQGSLDKVLLQEQHSVRTKINWSLHVAQGVDYMHSVPVIHRDLASRNCLVSGGKVKISDFGMSREGNEYRVPRKGAKIPIRW